MTMRNPLLITAIALGIAACTAGRTGPPAAPGIEFATPSDDKFLYPPVGPVILNPAPANPDSVDTPRNRAFCEQYMRTPPTGARPTEDSRLQPIHTAWMVTDANLPADCPQMLAKYDRARALHLIGKVHFLTGNPKQEGPYLAMIAGDEGVLVDGSGVTDFSAMLGRILPLTTLVLPFWLVRVLCKKRETIEVWPGLLACGLIFGSIQFFWSNFMGAALVDIVAGIGTLLLLAFFFHKVWKPRTVWRYKGEAAAAKYHLTAGDIVAAADSLFV